MKRENETQKSKIDQMKRENETQKINIDRLGQESVNFINEIKLLKIKNEKQIKIKKKEIKKKRKRKENKPKQKRKKRKLVVTEKQHDKISDYFEERCAVYTTIESMAKELKIPVKKIHIYAKDEENREFMIGKQWGYTGAAFFNYNKRGSGWVWGTPG